MGKNLKFYQIENMKKKQQNFDEKKKKWWMKRKNSEKTAMEWLSSDSAKESLKGEHLESMPSTSGTDPPTSKRRFCFFLSFLSFISFLSILSFLSFLSYHLSFIIPL